MKRKMEMAGRKMKLVLPMTTHRVMSALDSVSTPLRTNVCKGLFVCLFACACVRASMRANELCVCAHTQRAGCVHGHTCRNTHTHLNSHFTVICTHDYTLNLLFVNPQPPTVRTPNPFALISPFFPPPPSLLPVPPLPRPSPPYLSIPCMIQSRNGGQLTVTCLWVATVKSAVD